MKQPYLSLVSLLLFLATIAAIGQSMQGTPKEIIVVMALSVDPQATQEQINERARSFTAELRKRPGALDDTILKSTLPQAQPQYLLVMRWRQREDWESMLKNRETWGALDQSARPFRLERASYFTQLQ